jgi:hypothetical protein
LDKDDDDEEEDNKNEKDENERQRCTLRPAMYIIETNHSKISARIPMTRRTIPLNCYVNWRRSNENVQKRKSELNASNLRVKLLLERQR